MNKSLVEKTFNYIDRYKFYLLGVVYLLLLFSHFYWDFVITVRHSINFMEALFTGKLGSFYVDNALIQPDNSLFHPGGPGYDMPIYLIIGIWNLPLYLLDIIGIDPLVHTILLHWSKLQLLAILALSLYFMKRIASLIGMDKKTTEWCIFLTASSCLVMSPLLVSTQYDIIAACVMMIALYNYFKKKTWGFLLWFALAATLKGFALMFFLPLLLLQEKHIMKILWKLIVVVAPLIILRTLFPLTTQVQDITTGLFMRLFSWTIPSSFYHASVFLVLSIILWVFCYQKKPLEGIQQYSVPLYASFTGMGLFIATVYVYPYWVVLIAPFLYLSLFLSSKKFRITLLLETVFTISLTVLFQVVFYWCYDFKTIAPTLLAKLLREVPENLLNMNPLEIISRYVSGTNIQIGMFIASSSVVAGVVLLLWFLYPRERGNDFVTQDTVAEQMPLLIGRTVISIFTCLIPVAIYLAWVIFR